MTPERFTEVRKKELRLTQAKLAAALGVSTRTVAAYEAGESPIPQFIQLALMAVRAGLTIV